MPPVTRSRTGATEIAATKTKSTVKSGATSKSKSNPPPKKKARSKAPSSGNELPIDNGPPTALVLHFANLPLDLFLEIAKYIHPLDLIQLSRSNKLLRSMFMRRPAADVWRVALANTGLPPCPDSSISEPRYAALMFLEQCTECFRPATCHVDPILLVRLCYKCRKDMALTPQQVRGYKEIIPRSEFLVPPRGNAPRSHWYLSCHYEEAVEEYRHLHEIEGHVHDVCKAWTRERTESVRTRRLKATPLIEWVEEKEEEYKVGLKIVREYRTEQIEDRLLELGWELEDIERADRYSEKWRPFFSKTKLLDDQEWNDILPHLVRALEKARNHRMRAEADERQRERLHIIDNWLRSLPKAQVGLTLRWKYSEKRPTLNSAEASHVPAHPEISDKQNLTVKISSYPFSRYLIQSGQSYLEAIVDQDKSMIEFNLEFGDKRASIGEQLYANWRPNLETALVKTLPADLTPVDLECSSFCLQACTNTKNSIILNDRLSPDLRRLLRADVRFRYQSRAVYYPDGFDNWTVEKCGSTYDPRSSALAKALLDALQRPNASYLEMQVLGRSFICGRCTREPSYQTWESIIEHYLHEEESWTKACRRNARCSLKGEGIKLIFTHDRKNTDIERPLVRLVPEQDQTSRTELCLSKCNLCYGIGHYYQTEPSYIKKHVQEVHLIDDPVLGEHYAEPIQWYY